MDGASEGMRLGMSEGTMEAWRLFADGDGIGETVGAPEGARLGKSLGTAEEVGIVEGARLGKSLGIAEPVGAEESSFEICPQAESHTAASINNAW